MTVKRKKIWPGAIGFRKIIDCLPTLFVGIFYSALLSTSSLAQSTAALLPQGKQQFFDNNGDPLTSGKVFFYVPSTTTTKTTWQDSSKSVANSNPVVLDGGGRAIIYGDGTYRQLVKDRNNNTIYDALTASAGTGGGTTGTGDGDLVGTVKPWAGLSAPNQYAFAYGQEVSRTTYSVLYTAITLQQSINCTSGSPTASGFSDTSQIPINGVIESLCFAPGTTVLSKTSSTVTFNNNATISTSDTVRIFLYGNGNGSTTFNLPDLRGYTVVGRCNMGGTNCTNLTTGFSSNLANATGQTGGIQSQTLVTNNLPPYTPTGTIDYTPAGSVINAGSGNATYTPTGGVTAAGTVTNSGTSSSTYTPEGTITFGSGGGAQVNTYTPAGGNGSSSVTGATSGVFTFPTGQGGGTTKFYSPDAGSVTTQLTVGGNAAAQAFTGTNVPVAFGGTSRVFSFTNSGSSFTGDPLNFAFVGSHFTPGAAGSPLFTGTEQGGISQAIPTVQPSFTLNYIIKITPDSNSADASGVTSLGGMTGDIACGAGLLCTSNTISATIGAGTAGYALIGNGASAATFQGFTQTGTEATARIWQSKVAEIFSIKDFGAVGDGTTDDTAAIQAAITATPAAGTLYIPCGIYSVRGSGAAIFTLTQAINFLGQGTVCSQIAIHSSTSNTTDIFKIAPSVSQVGWSFRNLIILAQTVEAGRDIIKVDTVGNPAVSIYPFIIDSTFMSGTRRWALFTDSDAISNSIFDVHLTKNVFGNGIKFNNAGDSIRIDGNNIGTSGTGISNPCIDINQASGAGNTVITKNNLTCNAGQVVIRSGIAPVISENIVEQVANSTETNLALIDLIGGGAASVTGAQVINNQIQVLPAAVNTPNPIRVGAAVIGTVIDNNGRLAIPTAYSHMTIAATANGTYIGAGNRCFTADILVNCVSTNLGTSNDVAWQNQITSIANASYAALFNDRNIVYTTISASRTVTLPAAASVKPGTTITIRDASGSASQVNTIIAAPNGTDLLNGVNASTTAVSSAQGFSTFLALDSSQWAMIENTLIGDVTGTSLNTNMNTTVAKVNGVTYPASPSVGTIPRVNASNTVLYTATPVLGVPTSTIGTLGLAGNTSGTATITPQAAAGTPTLTLPNASGTFAVSATSPLVLSATTGALTCSTCATTAGANIPTIAQGDILYGSAANTLSALAKDGTTSYLSNTGSSNNPAWVHFGTGVATALASGVTGSGNIALATSPTFVTPVLGAATATSINFGGTSLANYVEGTWIPAITTSGTVGTPAYSVQVGSYERIGRQVTARFSITLSGWTGSPTGNVSISGLPLANTATTDDRGVCFIGTYSVTGLAASNFGIIGTIAESATSILLGQNGNTASGPITAAQFGTTGLVRGFCNYHV